MRRSGFTLIETLIYIVLLSLAFGFLLPSMYRILATSRQTSSRLEIETEGRFLMRKIGWALLGAETINQPASGATSTSLSVTKYNISQNPLVFDSASGTARLSRGAGSPLSLTNSGVRIDQLLFQQVPASGTVPAAIVVSFSAVSLRGGAPTAVSSTFQNTIYLRK